MGSEVLPAYLLPSKVGSEGLLKCLFPPRALTTEEFKSGVNELDVGAKVAWIGVMLAAPTEAYTSGTWDLDTISPDLDANDLGAVGSPICPGGCLAKLVAKAKAGLGPQWPLTLGPVAMATEAVATIDGACGNCVVRSCCTCFDGCPCCWIGWIGCIAGCGATLAMAKLAAAVPDCSWICVGADVACVVTCAVRDVVCSCKCGVLVENMLGLAVGGVSDCMCAVVTALPT